MKKYKILMYSAAFIPEANPEAFVNANLAYALKVDGHHVDIIKRGGVKSSFKTNNNRQDERWKSLKNNIFEISYNKNKSMVDYLKNIYACVSSRTILRGNKVWKEEFQKGEDLHLKKQYDFILARALPVAGLLAAYKLSKKYNIPLLVNINDPTAISPPPYPSDFKKYSFPFVNRFIKKVFHQAEAVSFPSQFLLNYELKCHNLVLSEKMCVIPHFANTEVKMRNKNLCSEFIISHAGTISDGRNPTNFLNAFSKLQKMHPETKITFKIMGVVYDGWKDLISNYENIELIGNTEQHRVNEILSASALQLIIECPCKTGIFLPSKFVDYIFNERPILAVSPEKGTLKEFLYKYKVGKSVNCDKVEDILSGLEYIYKLWAIDAYGKEFEYETAKKCFTSDIIMTYNNLFNEIYNAQDKRRLN